jgi:hypothetical protein
MRATFCSLGVAWHYQTSQVTMIAQNDRDIWTAHTFLPPDVRLDEIDPATLVHRFAERPFPFEILVANPWNPHLLVAQSYGRGRVFFAGTQPINSFLRVAME